MDFPKVSKLKTTEQFVSHLKSIGAEMPFDDVVDPTGPLSTPIDSPQHRIGNRFAILPMEGWDGTKEGKPTELTTRRWRNFGLSGAKLIWGGEAVAVRHDGRANPNQLLMNEANVGEIALLRKTLVETHAEHFGEHRRFISWASTYSFRPLCTPKRKSKTGTKNRLSTSNS